MTRTVLACSLLFAFASAASADPVEVSIDQSKILTLNQPAKEIILGNPSIVDASILHENLLVLTGKTPGVTQLLVRDDNGGALLNNVVAVGASVERKVRLIKGAQQSTYVCGQSCEASLSVSDDPSFFGKVLGQGADKPTGGSPPCDKADAIASDGKRCGGRSAEAREGGREPGSDFVITFDD